MIRIALATASIFGLIQPALAGEAAVPAPIVGAGLPLLLAAGGVYLAVKLVRARRRR